MRRTWLGLISFGSAVVAGCGVGRGPVSIHSDDTDLKIQAIKQDVDSQNHTDVATMVGDLDSEDPAVRFYSIEGLRRLTHDSFGYRYYETEIQRTPASERWKQWLKQRN